MTCIVGFCNEKTMVMGGDSAAVGGLELTIRKDPKVFSLKQINGPNLLVGFTSSFRMGQLLMTMEVPQDESNGEKPFEFMIKKFIPEVRAILKKGGFTTIKENEEIGGSFLVGYRGNIFNIENDFQVGYPASPYYAVGCGAPYALGAMDILIKTNLKDYELMVKTALAVAECRSAGVRRPFNILKIDFT